MQSFRQRLIWVRETLGLSLKQAEEGSGVSSSLILRWETGEKSPTVHRLSDLYVYYKTLWEDQKKHSVNVNRLTLTWLVLGEDSTVNTLSQMIQIAKDDYREREFEYLREMKELKERNGAI